MAIINLGQLGERRESALGGVAKAVGRYTDALAKAKSEHAKLESDQAEKSRSYFREAYKSYWQKKEAGQNIGESEEKEFLKASKKYLPEWFDSGGKPIRYPVEEIPWEPKTREEQIKFKADSEAALFKVKAGQPLTVNEAGVATNAIDIMIYRKAIDQDTGRALLEKIGESMKSKFGGALKGSGEGVDQSDPLGILGR